MNKMNEQTMQPYNLAVITSRTADEQIEVFPGYFVKGSKVKVELTNAGRFFLQALCNDYANERISVDEFLTNIETISNELSCGCYYDMVHDKMLAEAYDMLNN